MGSFGNALLCKRFAKAVICRHLLWAQGTGSQSLLRISTITTSKNRFYHWDLPNWHAFRPARRRLDVVAVKERYSNTDISESARVCKIYFEIPS